MKDAKQLVKQRLKEILEQTYFSTNMTEEQFDQRLEYINQLVDQKPPTMADIIQNQANFINAIKQMEEIEEHNKKQRKEYTEFVENIQKQIFGDKPASYRSCITHDTSGNIH
ncbi:hypothetical protein ACTOJ1_000526 [Shigella flexneri]